MNKTFAILATLAALSTGAIADSGSNGESRFENNVASQSVVFSAGETTALTTSFAAASSNAGSNGAQRYGSDFFASSGNVAVGETNTLATQIVTSSENAGSNGDQRYTAN